MPEDLRTIRRKIKTVTNVAQITRAMKMVAAARLRRCQQAVEQHRAYWQAIRQVTFQVMLELDGPVHPYISPREPERPLLMVVAGDRGLCGSYNALLFRRADEELERLKPALVIGVGDKAQTWAAKAGVELAASFHGFGGRAAGRVHEQVAQKVTSMFDQGLCDAVFAVHTPFRSMLHNIPTTTRVLPLLRPEEVPRPASVSADAKLPSPVGYLYEPRRERVLDVLFPRAARAQIVCIVLEAAAAEQAARMTAMTAATDNAEELIQELTRLRNRIRQQEITTEILEVVAGADAIVAE